MLPCEPGLLVKLFALWHWSSCWSLSNKPKLFQSLEIRMLECVWGGVGWILSYSIVSLFIIFQLHIGITGDYFVYEWSKIEITLLNSITGCPQESCVVYLCHPKNNTYFLWLWILQVKTNLQSSLLSPLLPNIFCCTILFNIVLQALLMFPWCFPLIPQ